MNQSPIFWGNGPHKQRGLSMPEIMLGLALIAVVVAGGIIGYNEVQPRVVANNYQAGLNGFFVDIAQWRTTSYTPQPNGNTRAQSVSEKDWAGTAAIDQFSITCTANGVPHPDCVGTTALSVPDPNLAAFSRIPALRHWDSPDDDSTAEWSVRVSDNIHLEVAWVLVPDGSVVTAEGPSNTAWDTACENTTAAAWVTVALEERLAVCEALSVSAARMDHVSTAWCSELTSGTTGRDGDIGLHLCVSEP